MEDSDDIVKEFLIESYENLDRLDRELITLEQNPEDRDILSSIFRTIHTIKGTSGFLTFSQLGAVAHAGESLLGRLRDDQLVLNREITSALLATVDAVRQILTSIELSGIEGVRDDSDLIARLTRLQQVSEPASKASAPIIQAISAPENEPGAATRPTSIGDILMRQAGVSPAEIQEAVAKQQAGDPRHMGEILVEQGAAQPADVVDALRAQQTARGQSASDSTIRLDVRLLDQLMNLVGELVLVRNQILRFASSREGSGLLAASQKLNLITTELQEGVMKTRMQPIGNIWNQLPRTVRDLALGCEKQVRVEMEGKETELDKTLIEAIKDPLTHIVRNSVDHGIERAEVRRAAGKDPEGLLLLRAFHEGGQVNIEISDDGAGLDQTRIRDKAVQKSLISAEQASRMSDREIMNLVFLPGFSTAEKLTSVSGRGVGMDVVKTYIEKIGGTVDLQSKLGHGMKVRMKIPLTLAIVPALIVTSGGERYAIPQLNLLELVRLGREQARKDIEIIQAAPVYRLRGRLLPLLYLENVLQRMASCEQTTGSKSSAESGRSSVRDKAPGRSGSGSVNIVVLVANGQDFGLVVDEIIDTEEIVVKPLGQHLANISLYAGASIMGDGKVALILDVLGLAKCSSLLAEGHELPPSSETRETAEESQRKQKLVLFRGRAGAQMAVPLNLLARLENIPGTKVERSGNQWVTQCRGQILPLIRISHAMEERRHLSAGEDMLTLPTTSVLEVLVLETEHQSFGLVVNQIVDIVESTLEPQSPATRPGVLLSAVIGNRVTELLDVPALLRAGEVYERTEGVASSG
jgi:two-component system chemotaxis sensor kinase CheA